MIDWQPKKCEVETGILVMESPHDSVMHVNCSEGDTVFIGQNTHDGGEIQHIAIGRYELYNIIFNFMSVDELNEVLAKKHQLK